MSVMIAFRFICVLFLHKYRKPHGINPKMLQTIALCKTFVISIFTARYSLHKSYKIVHAILKCYILLNALIVNALSQSI